VTDDLTPRNLAALVTDKITELGDTKAREYFGVSAGTISAWKNGKTAPSLEAAQKVWDGNLLAQTPEVWGGNGKEDVCVCLPMYETAEPFFLISFLKMLKGYGLDRVRIIPKTRTLIEEARNDLVERALLTNCKKIVMMDCDMIPPCGSPGLIKKMGVNIPDAKAAINALIQITSHPEEYRIIGALYKDRRGGNRVQCAKAFSSPQENVRLMGMFDGKTQATALEEAGGWVAMGMTMFHRNVFEQMRAEAIKPGSPLAEICPPPPPRDKEPFGYFGRSSKYRGEDVAVCRRAESIGITTWIDPQIVCGHVGRRVF
jgi:hypothetical protein